MSFDPGAVIIRHAGGETTVTSERPRVSELFRGKPVAGMLAMIPMVFAVCGQAQGAAARAAVAAARGEPVAPVMDAAIAAEAAREHLFYLLGNTDRALLAQAWRETRVPGDAARAMAAQLLGMEGEAFLGLRSLEHLGEWSRLEASLPERFRQLHQGPVPNWHSRPLPSLPAEESLIQWPRLDANFAAAPLYQGVPAETGAWARQVTDPLLENLADRPFQARWLARLKEWVTWCCTGPLAGPGRLSSVTVAESIGRSAVETARGLLLHEVRLNGDVLEDLVIVAPTEWNFHPQGVLASWLRLGGDSGMIEEGVKALDPCVPLKIA